MTLPFFCCCSSCSCSFFCGGVVVMITIIDASNSLWIDSMWLITFWVHDLRPIGQRLLILGTLRVRFTIKFLHLQSFGANWSSTNNHLCLGVASRCGGALWHVPMAEKDLFETYRFGTVDLDGQGMVYTTLSLSLSIYIYMFPYVTSIHTIFCT